MSLHCPECVPKIRFVSSLIFDFLNSPSCCSVRKLFQSIPRQAVLLFPSPSHRFGSTAGFLTLPRFLDLLLFGPSRFGFAFSGFFGVISANRRCWPNIPSWTAPSLWLGTVQRATSGRVLFFSLTSRPHREQDRISPSYLRVLHPSVGPLPSFVSSIWG